MTLVSFRGLAAFTVFLALSLPAPGAPAGSEELAAIALRLGGGW